MGNLYIFQFFCELKTALKNEAYLNIYTYLYKTLCDKVHLSTRFGGEEDCSFY